MLFKPIVCDVGEELFRNAHSVKGYKEYHYHMKDCDECERLLNDRFNW